MLTDDQLLSFLADAESYAIHRRTWRPMKIDGELRLTHWEVAVGPHGCFRSASLRGALTKAYHKVHGVQVIDQLHSPEGAQ